MNLPLIVLGLLSVSASAFVTSDVLESNNMVVPQSTASFVIDNMVVKQNFWSSLGLHDTGTKCHIWVKHGNNGAISRHGLGDAPQPSAWFNQRTVNIHAFEFPPRDHVSVNQRTFAWTSCRDALVIDYALLQAGDRSRMWGLNNEYAWCLSMDNLDGDNGDFNEDSREDLNWRVISAGRCYSTLRFNPNGRVSGWTGWTPTNWETSTGRRMLDAAEAANLPTAEEVNACVEDDSRDEEECDALVDQILSFEIEHPEGFHRAVEIPFYEDDIVEDDESNTDTETATDGRRVLSALRRLSA